MKAEQILSAGARAADEWYALVTAPVIAIDATKAQNFRVVLGQNADLRIDGGSSCSPVFLRVEQDATGSRTLTANASIVFRNGETTLPLVSSAGSVTVMQFVYDEAARAWECVTWLSRARADGLYQAAGSYQPLDADLTAIAALTTTAYGIDCLTLANAAAARTKFGLGTISTQDANNVSITGGSVSGITDLPVADGGTGASTAANARTNLGLGVVATFTADTGWTLTNHTLKKSLDETGTTLGELANNVGTMLTAFLAAKVPTA